MFWVDWKGSGWADVGVWEHEKTGRGEVTLIPLKEYRALLWLLLCSVVLPVEIVVIVIVVVVVVVGGSGNGNR